MKKKQMLKKLVWMTTQDWMPLYISVQKHISELFSKHNSVSVVQFVFVSPAATLVDMKCIPDIFSVITKTELEKYLGCDFLQVRVKKECKTRKALCFFLILFFFK